METKDKQILWGVGAVVLLLVLLFVFSGRVNLDRANDADTDSQMSMVSEEARVSEQSADESLGAFPEGFPVEEGMSESKGYKYIPANSTEQQSTLEYTSTRSLSENALRFREFLTENEFEIVNELSEEGLVFYYATKDGDDLTMTIEDSNGQVTVSVSLLKR